MALLQLGSVVTGIRNSVKGTTYSQNKGGAYLKGKPIPTNPRTSRQTAVRAQFAANAKLWSGTMTSDQRAAWTLFAQNNPYTNVFGEVKQLSGMAIAMSLNQVLAQMAVAPILDAPANLNVPALAAITGVDFTFAAGSLSEFELDTAAQAVVAGARYYVFATPCLAAGKAAGQSDFRFIGAFPAVAAAVIVDILDLYQSVFGFAQTAGTHISVVVSTANHATGAVTPGLRFDTGLLS